MARVTARTAYTRARSRRENSRAETTRQVAEARSRYVQQMADLASISAKVANTENLPTAQKIKLSTKCEAMFKKAAAENRKITDYYHVLSKGRENVPKSPSQIARVRRISTPHMMAPIVRRPRPVSNVSCSSPCNSDHIDDVECITISDTEEDTLGSSIAHENSEINNNENDTSGTPRRRTPVKSEILNSPLAKISPEEITAKIDDDIEITDILPPIPLRDHPVYEVEET